MLTVRGTSGREAFGTFQESMLRYHYHYHYRGEWEHHGRQFERLP